MDNTMDIARIFRKLIKRIWLIIAVTVIFTIAGIFYTANPSPNLYMANVSLYSIAYGSYRSSMEGFSAMMDYAEIISSKKVADRVVNDLAEYNLSAMLVQSMVSTSYRNDSAIFHIRTVSEDPVLAINVANSVADAFILEVRYVTGADSVKILDKAEQVSVYYDGRVDQLKTRFIFMAVGFIFICGVISLAEIFSKKINLVDDATLKGEIKLLGVIPKHRI
jgi:capsular polysaccharide biosynthesis protein